ncbi:MAG: 3,4-dihydroxy-2-butanone-4-phosphate synthase [Chromatocurvus sp.]
MSSALEEESINSVEELLSDIRLGRMVVLLDDDGDTRNEGVVMVAAEHCKADHVTFMARRARGLVCLGLTRERCLQLDLPPMVENAVAENASFTLSIEAREGIDTGISAADRAHTVQVAVAPHAGPADIVQPGHIFPLASAAGGVLTRAGHTEAAVDFSRIAGLHPAAVITDVLTDAGELSGGAELVAFAREHGLKIGTIADLIHYRLMHERTIEPLREGRLQTVFGDFDLKVYRDQTAGDLHLALHCGDINADTPTLVRVHARATLRDLLGTDLEGTDYWRIGDCLAHIAREGKGVLVLLARRETDEQLLHSVDLALGKGCGTESETTDTYTTVGLGSQILRDLGVGRMHLLGAPMKYNAISGFGLEVLDYVRPLKQGGGE